LKRSLIKKRRNQWSKSIPCTTRRAKWH